MGATPTLLPLEKLSPPEFLNGISKENIGDILSNRMTPAVIKGFAKNWPLVLASQDKSASVINKLKQSSLNKPQQLVILAKETGGRMFYNEQVNGFNYQAQRENMNACLDAMALYELGKSDSRACVQCVPVAPNFKDYQSLIDIPQLPNLPSFFFWIGNDTIIAPHFDEAQNLAVVATGRRRFTLFPPEQVSNLYIGPLDFTPAGQPISLVDITNPDLSRFPRYALAYEKAMSVVLEPGDAIYIPSPWWHHVQALEKFNLLVNFWWNHSSVASQMPYPALMHSLLAFRNLPTSEKQAWQAMMEHFVFERTDASTVHIPQPAQGVLGKISPKLASGLHNWLKQFYN